MRPLGPKQRDLLQKLSSIHMALVVPCAVSNSLVRRGILDAEPDGSFAHITAAGLRVLADEIDAGRVSLYSVDQMRKDLAADPERPRIPDSTR